MAHDPHHSPTDAPHTMLDVDKVSTVVTVYAVVLGLALANIFLAGTGLGALALPVQLGIAAVQASLVAWYWMHMRRDHAVLHVHLLRAGAGRRAHPLARRHLTPRSAACGGAAAARSRKRQLRWFRCGFARRRGPRLPGRPAGRLDL
jgi:caa(3)-type oxidase subunit IV